MKNEVVKRRIISYEGGMVQFLDHWVLHDAAMLDPLTTSID